MHVLVADDDRIAATLVARTIREWNYEVTVVADGPLHAGIWSRRRSRLWLFSTG